ncbi:MAG: aldehyde dehydrogenase family protein, partial [Actinomycetota bacterium]
MADTHTETCRNYIGGEWVEAASGETFADINPADTDDVVAHFQSSTAEDVRAAIDAAAKAQPEWAAVTPPKRGEVLARAARIIEADA